MVATVPGIKIAQSTLPDRTLLPVERLNRACECTDKTERAI